MTARARTLILTAIVCILAAAPIHAAKPAPRAKASTAPLGPLAKPDADGFSSMLNGKDTSNWVGANAGYPVIDGVMVCQRKGGGNLYTRWRFADFHLKFDFKLTPGANNGLGIRVPPRGNPASGCMELQILDNTAAKYAKLKPYQFHGSVYGMVPAERGHLNPVGEWNREEIVCDGSRIKVTLNDVVIVDAFLDQIDKTMDGKPHPGLHNEKGHIGFLGHGSRVEFRNIRIKEFASQPQPFIGGG